MGEINWNASGGIKKPSDYVESWRILLWDKAFQLFLNPLAKPAFLKSYMFEKHPGAPLAVKRVSYRYVFFLWSFLCFFLSPFPNLNYFCIPCRYVMRELIAKHAIPSQSVPPYFGAWVQLSSDLCMYTPLQQKRYALNHLEAGCWYLDCPAGYTLDEEVQIRQTLDSASTPPAGASDVVDITEEEPVQPAPDEGSVPKKKRMTKAAKEAAEKEAAAKEVAMKEAVAKDAAAKVAKEMEKQPMDATTTAASCVPSSPALVTEGHFLNPDQQGTLAHVSSQLHPSYRVVQTTEELRGQRIFQQMPSGSTSIAQALPVEVMLENASLFAVMDTLGTPTGPDPLWMKVHEFITKVNCGSNVLICFPV